jgi:hypothetical protein
MGGLDSHTVSTLNRYRRMLAVYAPIEKQILASHARELTAQQIKEIISARSKYESRCLPRG